MFSRIRWRIATVYTLLIAVVMAALWIYLNRSACLGSPTCILRGVVAAAVLLALLSAALALFVAERTARPIRELTRVIRRMAAGDTKARILPQTRDEVGQLTRAFNDMTDEMRTRSELLMAENQQLTAVLEFMADGALITDHLSYVTLINPAAARLLKTTQSDALGRSFAEVVRHHQLIDLWQACQREGREQVAAVEVGRELFLQAFVTPFQEQGARGYLVILQDLTQVRRLQTVRRDFVSNISHELRTPLASLRAVVETLQDGALEDPPVAQRFLERAEREVDTLTQMVEELLELSRIESGQVPLQLSATSVADLFLVPMERLRTQAERGEIALILNLPGDLPHVLADVDRMQQVVTNLLHNAIKFTPPGGSITITASFNESADEVVMAVADTGAGIPKEDLPRIFERFYKIDRSRTRRQEGTGLGLAIARHLVQAHNGRIWANSKEGKGSTFYFSLPPSG